MYTYNAVDEMVSFEKIDILAIIAGQMHGIGPVAAFGPLAIHCNEAMCWIDGVPELICLSEVLVCILGPPVKSLPLRWECFYSSCD